MATMNSLRGLSRRERLDWLSTQLKKPLPGDFDWYYPVSTRCAIGLYERLSLRRASPSEFGISKDDYDLIFYSRVSAAVTPLDVAARIDATEVRLTVLERLERFTRWAFRQSKSA